MALVQDIYVDVCLPRPHADEIAQLARVSRGGVLGAANRLGQQSEAGCLCRTAPDATVLCGQPCWQMPLVCVHCMRWQHRAVCKMRS